MAEPDRRCRRASGILTILTLLAACGGGKSEPQTTAFEDAVSQATAVEAQGDPLAGESPPQERAPEASEQLEPAAEESIIVESDPQVDESLAAASQEDAGSLEDDKSIVMIESGTEVGDADTASLVEAARSERERRQTAPPSQIVITDETLADYATGDLTVAAGPAAGATDDPDPDAPDTIQLAEDEAYWRDGAREIRLAWKEAVERVEELEGKVFDLRQRFYREDDGFYRDGQIKPAWDLAIEQLEAARREVEKRQEELELFLEEGRQAGALAGWLREGIELEPIEQQETDNISEPDEPVIYQDDGSHDPP